MLMPLLPLLLLLSLRLVSSADVTSCYPLTRALPRSYDTDGNPSIKKPHVADRAEWWCPEDKLAGFVSLSYPHVGDCSKEESQMYQAFDQDFATIARTGAVMIDFGPRLDGCSQESLYFATFYAAFHSLGIKLTLSKTYAGLMSGFREATKLLKSLENLGSYMIYSLALVDYEPADFDDFDIEDFLFTVSLIKQWAGNYSLPLEFKTILGRKPRWTSRATEAQVAQLDSMISYWDYKANIAEEACLDAEASAKVVRDKIETMKPSEPTTITAMWITHPQQTISRNLEKECDQDDGFYKSSPEDTAAFLAVLQDCTAWSNITLNAGVFSDENAIGLGLFGNRTVAGVCEPFVNFEPEICHFVGPSTTTPSIPTTQHAFTSTPIHDGSKTSFMISTATTFLLWWLI